MAQYWFFLTDPAAYHLDELFRKGGDVWDGVRGSNALKHLARVRKGDQILGYHTAPLKAVYALLEATSDAYPDPNEPDKNIAVVDVKGTRKLPNPVPLAALRSNRQLSGMAFLRIARIAVSPLSTAEFDEICRLGGLKIGTK